jgi:hypothetical protein
MSAGQSSVTVTAEPQRTETTLVGFADVTLAELGLVVRAELHASGGHRWVVPIDVWRDGRSVVLQFGDAGTANCFSQRLLAASPDDAFAVEARHE